MSEKLQEWAMGNIPKDGLIYKNSYWEQIKFVRDTLPELFCTDCEHYQKIKSEIEVISTHRSKSILLPVFAISLSGNLRLIMRYNFHNWKISVISSENILFDAGNLFNPDETHPSVYCEGFPGNLVYGSYSNNKLKFTIALRGGYYEIFTYFWLFANWKKRSISVNLYSKSKG